MPASTKAFALNRLVGKGHTPRAPVPNDTKTLTTANIRSIIGSQWWWRISELTTWTRPSWRTTRLSSVRLIT